MQDTNVVRDNLIKDFAENYMEKVFYFCLKKTGGNLEAEELTQDISLQIISALNKGIIPINFSAWVWKIARNRYSVWAVEKRKRNESVTGSDISDYEIEDDNDNIIDALIHTEQLSLLRRELAFIKMDYRNILVAYYIEEKSIREIASLLSLTESAVQQRLHRARLILKEGMDMAREFGKLSYNPENVFFFNNGCFGNDGEPWNYISRSLCKNILLAAYRTPATAEELSMEVGVALPYMEEELAHLVEATLMKKNGNRYETNFFIVSSDAQEKIYAHLRGISSELTDAVIEALNFDLNWRNENCPEWHDGHRSLEDMKWSLLMEEADITFSYTLKPYNKDVKDVPNIGKWGHTLRPNGGEWDILGMEEYYGNKPKFVSLTGCVSSPREKELPEILFRQFIFNEFSSDHFEPYLLTYADGEAMVAVANGKYDGVSDVILKRLESHGYIMKDGDAYVPTILVIRKDKMLKMPKEIREHLESLRYKARDIATRHYLFCREQIYKEIPDFLKNDDFQIDQACANIFSIRGAILEEAIKKGYLLKNNINDKSLGAYLTI